MKQPCRSSSASTLLIGTLLLAVPAAAAADVQFNDGTFDASLWESIRFMANAGGSSVTQDYLSGGNPAEWEEILTSVNTGDPSSPSQSLIFRRRIGADYDPAAQGPIDSIDYSEDNYWEFGGRGDGQATGPALRQAGRVYIYEGIVTGQIAAWQTVSRTGLRSGDFVWVAGLSGQSGFLDRTTHPDFSASGAPIEFGFYRANTSIGSPFMTDAGVDNWALGVLVMPVLGVRSNVQGQTEAMWTAVNPGTVYDVVRGDLGVLHASKGDFTAALDAISPGTDACVANDSSSTSVIDTKEAPPVGSGWFYIVRRAGGTYNSGSPSQVGDRDAEIAASLNACP